jgi:hypothetical protein
LTIWELASGKLRSEYWENGTDRLDVFFDRDPLYGAVAFTPDGTALALAGRDDILLWDVRLGREIRRFGATDMHARSVAFSPDGKLLAALQYNGGLCLWDVATGTQLCRVSNGTGRLTSFCFSPDGKMLATAGHDTTVLVWDTRELLAVPTAKASAKVLDMLWQDLASADAVQAGKAIARLQEAGTAAAVMLKARVQPIAPPDPKLLKKLLSNLESDKFAMREQAGQELLRLGDLALPVLRQVLKNTPPLETEKRVTKLAARLEGPTADTKVLQLLRAIEVLEEIAGPEAQAALEKLAQGMTGHRVTAAAQEALERTRQGKKMGAGWE